MKDKMDDWNGNNSYNRKDCKQIAYTLLSCIVMTIVLRLFLPQIILNTSFNGVSLNMMASYF